jgi:hypothetical protein
VSAGSGILYGPDDDRNTYLKLRTDVNSTQLGELAAILWAIAEEPPQNELIILTKSAYALNGILEGYNKWEPTGYIGVKNKDLFKNIIATLRGRGGPTRFKRIANTSVSGYIGAKDLARRGATKEAYDEPNLDVHPSFNLIGAQLATLTQSLAYKGVCESKGKVNRRGTAQMLAITRHAVKERTGTFPDDGVVWKSTRHRDFSKVFRTFIWKSIHNTHKIGDYWSTIDNYGHRATCMRCETTESLEHILLHCDIPGRKVVWENVKKLWLRKQTTWPELTNIGLITGCGLIKFNDDEGRPLWGTDRAYRILISESAHFIWKLQCSRIQSGTPEEEWPKDVEIQHRWLATINARLTLDRASTSRKYGKKAIKQKIVLRTWERMLQNENDLPNNWLTSPGVLVGIDQMEHRDGIPDNPDDPP